jgi:PleD family two-component response regulator
MMNNDTPIRVLLVDDEQMSADMLAGMFADSSGVTVRHVGDPAQALPAAHEFGPSVAIRSRPGYPC